MKTLPVRCLCTAWLVASMASATSGAETLPVKEKTALEAANHELEQLHLLEKVELKKQTEDQLPWDGAFLEVFNKDGKSLLYNALKKTLKDNPHYCAFYYAPKEARLGGDATLFVSGKTGEVIAKILGK